MFRAQRSGDAGVIGQTDTAAIPIRRILFCAAWAGALGEGAHEAAEKEINNAGGLACDET
jgi:hypothetical protein